MKRRVGIAVIMLAVIFVGIALWFCWPRYLGGNDKYHWSIADLRTIASACRAYSLQSGGAYPEKLGDLIHPPFGKKPFLDSKDAIIDPWDKPYRYAVVPNERGEPEVYVWTEYDDDGGWVMIGVKVRADGSTVRFEGHDTSG